MKPNKVTRRNFLKSAAMASGAMALPTSAADKPLAKEGAWFPGKQIHPQIDNLHVVACQDPFMLTGVFSPKFVDQNARVDPKRTADNLDRMAMALAGVESKKEAWARLFRKPESKAWSEIRCAVKLNAMNLKNMPRVAVVGKVCMELINLGVAAGNIVVFDGVSRNRGPKQYHDYLGNGLPKGIIISRKNDALGGIQKVKALPGYSVAPKKATCTTDILNGKIDVLVNIAVNKHHGDDYGAVTLCMKNHFGTFEPSPDGHGDFRYLIAMNKSEAIIGGSPARQQLCLVDNLWASHKGWPTATPTGAPAGLVMGTFAPAVDYLTAKADWKYWKGGKGKLLRHKLAGNTERFLTEFGYAPSERDNAKLVWI